MIKKKRIRGYVSSNSIFNTDVPQQIQNMAIRDYCQRNLHYLLSATEYAIQDSCFILNGVVTDSRFIDGLAAYSLFQMPTNEKIRINIYKTLIKKNRSIHFVMENLKIEKKLDIQTVETLYRIKASINKNSASLSKTESLIKDFI